MIRPLLLIISISWLAGCSILTPQNSAPTLGHLSSQEIKILPNTDIAVDHQEVLMRYQQYLDVGEDAELRVRVAHRMAALKLQQQELAFNIGSDNFFNEEARDDVIDDYQHLLTAHPDRTDNDTVLYQLAKAYSLVGQRVNSIATLKRLIQEHPDSSYLLESLFRLGQMHYAGHNYAAAADAYQQLINIGSVDNEYYTSAGYLYAWSLFQQSQFEESLLAFTRVLDEEFTDEQAFNDEHINNQDIRDDILRIMAVIFTELGDWEQVAVFYDKHGQRFYEYKIYDRLATLYYEREHYRSAASTLRAFVLRYPQDKRAADYYQRLIEGYHKARYSNLARRHQEEYIQRFGVNSEYWQQHPQQQAALTTIVSAYIWELSSFYHAWGQNTKQPKDKQERLTLAAKWYQHYVESFPQADDAVKAHFLLAEVSVELKDYRTARHHYEIVAYQYPDYEQAAEAGYAAILAYNQYRPTAEEAQLWRQATAASAMRFVQEFADDSRSGTVLVNTAEMLLKDKYYSQALHTARLAAKVENELTPRYRYGAALVRGHAAFELGYYTEAEEAISLALAQQQADRQTHKDLRSKLAASIYRQGEQHQEQENYAQAVEDWLRLGTIVPESDTKVLAQYDAATLLMMLEDYPRAIEVLTDFRQNYPKHRLIVDIPSKLIIAYEQQGQWQQAAFELKIIADSATDLEEQRIACYQAAEYFAKAEDYNNARDMYRTYAHQYPKPFDAAIEAHYQLDKIYAKMGEEDKRHFWLDKIISLHNSAGSEQNERSRYLAASAAFELAEIERAKFEKVAITLPLNKSITVKNNYLQSAQKRYTQAVQLGVLEFTTSSTYHLGELYAQMSQALNDSERPKGLDELELEEYEFLLEEQAYPLEEAAIEIHQTNTGRTRDYLFDGWVRKSFGSLAKLMPGQYNKPERVVSYVDQIR